MIDNIILASKSEIRKKILEEANFKVQVEPSNVDEEEIKLSMIANGANCIEIAKSLAEHKANRISSKFEQHYVLGADQVLDLDGACISKPTSKVEAKTILHSLNNKEHKLHNAICVSKNGSMIWHFNDTCLLKMKKLSDQEIDDYLQEIDLSILQQYGVYQVEGKGKQLFSSIKGDLNSILGMPIQPIVHYFTHQAK